VPSCPSTPRFLQTERSQPSRCTISCHYTAR